MAEQNALSPGKINIINYWGISYMVLIYNVNNHDRKIVIY